MITTEGYFLFRFYVIIESKRETIAKDAKDGSQ